MPTVQFPTISIVFPNLNGGNEPLDCIRSIYNLNYPLKKLEIIIFDNGSNDGSDNKIKNNFPKVKLIKSPVNIGFSQAVNAGIKLARGNFIFIGNDDLVFEKDSLSILMQYWIGHPNMGVLGGKIFLKSRPQQIASCGYFFNNWTGHISNNSNSDRITSPDWVQGCALLTTKKILKQIGYFDAGYSPIYFEDFDLCVRIKQKGYFIKYIPQAIFYHGEGTTMNKNQPNRYYQWYRSKIRFVLIHLPLINVISILLIQTLYTFVLNILRIPKNEFFTPYIKALIWNINNFNLIRQRKKMLKSSFCVSDNH